MRRTRPPIATTSILVALACARAANADESSAPLPTSPGAPTPLPVQPVAPTPTVEPRPIKVIEDDGAGPYYYRDLRPVFGGGFRISTGFDVRLGLNGEDGKTVFAFDALAAGRLGFGRGARVFALWPEGGYSYVGSDWHLVSAGVGPALQALEGFSVGLVPRLLYGIAGGQEAKGIRTCALFDFTLGKTSLGLEIAHQYVEWGDHHVHELRFAIESSSVWGTGDSI